MYNFKFKKLLIINIFHLFLFFNISNAEIVNKIIINGNERVSDATIIVFSSIKLGDTINEEKLNQIVNSLYDSNFFDNISTRFDNQQLTKQLDKSRANLTFILCECRNCIYSSKSTFIHNINVNNFTK